MAKLSPAQILGSKGGKKGGRQKSPAQTLARQANAAKARLKRAENRDKKLTESP